MEANGYLIINKPTGRTSFESLFPLKRIYGKKIGHTGTLDKFAEGLLVALVGKMTKFAGVVSDLDKVYEAEFTFGRETDTLDPEGRLVREAPCPPLDRIREALPQFTGKILQSPPTFSAVHVQGRRAYERTLAGETLVLPPRPLEIYSWEWLGSDGPRISFRIHCSKGTYIRALARDLGAATGSCAFVSRLRRTRVGPFEIPTRGTEGPPTLGTTEDFLSKLGVPCLSVSQTTEIRMGKPLPWILEGQSVPEGTFALAAPGGEVLALAENRAGTLRYRFVLS